MNTNERNVLAAILSGEHKTIEEISSAAEISERTVYRYLEDPAFKAELNARQDAVISQATARLARMTVKALDGLESVLDNPEIDGAANLRLAAKDTLKLLDLFTDREMEGRISRLEDLVLFKGEK